MTDDTPRPQDLLERVAQLEAIVTGQERIIAELRARLGYDSGNSHRPPSSDPPGSDAAKKRKRTRKASGRLQGGQPGRKGTTRVMLPAESVDRVEECVPGPCSGCGQELSGLPSEGEPERHQVSELPPVRPVVTEYRLHGCTCPGCGTRNRAALPAGVGWSAFGPGVHALVATLGGVYRLSRRLSQSLLRDFFGLHISLGAISHMETRVTRAVGPAMGEASAWMRTASCPTGMDETSWRQAGKRRWLWGAITKNVTLFAIRRGRGSEVVNELVGEAAGDRVVVTDRWSGYHGIPLERRQFCWSHLMRDFQKMAETSDEVAARTGRRLLWLGARMFRWLGRVREKELKPEDFLLLIDRLKPFVGRALERGAASNHRATAGTCRSLGKTQAALWTFAQHPDVEPTNNSSERALRPAVIWRRSSLGNQSDLGARFVECMLSISASLRSQRRSVFSFMKTAVDATFRLGNAPSLLPEGPVGT